MSQLDKYREKRDFSKTPEPTGNFDCEKEGNRFVIQRHIARREHYDFRLEIGSVLVSWAIPKRPVADPDVKRLAVKTEDHPLDYYLFEGLIPKGNYGAGSVMVWDYGHYFSQKDGSIISEEQMQEMIKKGTVKVHLQGVKIKGNFNLVKVDSNGKDEWLFMKGKRNDPDNFEERSALTGKTMDEIASEKKQTPKKNDFVGQQSYAERSEFPGYMSPMLASLADEAFSDKYWIFELKLDGYRLLAAKQGDNLTLYSRNGHDFSDKYPLIKKETDKLRADFVVDGEVCYMQGDRSDFQKLQSDQVNQENIHYFLFDILWLNGHDLKNVPLLKRKSILKQLLANSPAHLHYLDHIEEKGEMLFEDVLEKKLEGIIGKKADSHYYPAFRSKEWLKIKTSFRQEMLICGYIKSEKNDRDLKSLLCAVSSNDSFLYTGKVGTGFNQDMQKKIIKRLEDRVTDAIPVKNPPPSKDVIWTKPEVICEVRFAEWTSDKVMRHPSFIGLRSDKAPEDIKIQKPGKVDAAKRKFILSNPDKIFWKEEKIRKQDVYNYYENMAEVILPYMVNRPQSLYRTPDGINKKGFFQKNMQGVAPDWTETVKIEKEEGKSIEYLLCQDTDTLLYMVNLGCIEMNPWSASLPDLKHPDLMIFDLDPVDVENAVLIDVALQFKEVFDNLSIPAYCKTSGSRGLHIYVPLVPHYSYKQVQNFVRTIQAHVHKKMNKYTSFERSPSKRKGKIYLDYLQNGKGKTMSSVYSLRPRPGATVSTPLRWDELKHDLKPSDFNIYSLPKRIRELGDVWSDMLDTPVDLKQIIEKMK